MKILMLILTVMTFFVESKNKVSVDGTCPADVEVSYSNTYQKGQVRKGDTAKIELNKLGNIVVQRITAYVNSNQAGGAGQWTVSVNGSIVASKVGSFKEWVGAYDNTSYHLIELFSGSINGADQLAVELVGTDNSLYIEKYEITYEFAPSRTVTLMVGDDLYSSVIESQPGSGVELPTLPNHDQWTFVGWTTEPCYEQTQKPNILPLGTYHPSENCTLWAVYTYMPSEVVVTNLTSDTYAYANTQSKLAMQGAVQNGQMANASLDLYDENQYYYIEFTPNADTAYIYHPLSDSYIGYSGTKMAAQRAPWLVYHDANSTLFYILYGTEYYVLWPSMEKYVSDVPVRYAGLIKATSLEGTSVGLLSVSQLTNGPVYTCHPECGLDINHVETLRPTIENGEYRIPLGNYEIVIDSGRKILRPRL